MDDPFLWMKFRTTSILGSDPDSASHVPEDCELFERKDWTTKITYDPKTDTLTIILKDNVPVEESDEGKPGVVLDYDKEGNLISLEVLDASERVSEARKIEFQTTA